MSVWNVRGCYDPTTPVVQRERARAMTAEIRAAESARIVGREAGLCFAWREAKYDVRQALEAAQAGDPAKARLCTVGCVPDCGFGPRYFEGYEGSSVCMGASGARVAPNEVFVANMAATSGANAQVTATADQLRAEAQMVHAYNAAYITVGDLG